MTVIVATEEALRRVLREELRDELRRLQAGPGQEKLDASTLLTVADVAARLQVRAETVRGWIQARQLLATKAGRHWRVRPGDLEQFTARQTPGDGETISIGRHLQSLSNRMKARSP